MTNRIAIITGSTCAIPADWIRQYEIGVVPLTIIFGVQAYKELFISIVSPVLGVHTGPRAIALCGCAE